ncbi:MAG: glycosyltransferase family 4 protein [SAR202 cluster bacterium]|nr:glycosyltransferase family 4 protein [SAR202 cluster bacterium]
MISDVLVSTIDPVGRGGVYAMASELAHSLRQWGREPSFLYLSASQEDNLFPRSLLRRGRLWGAVAKSNRGLEGMAVGHVAAHFPSLTYIWWPYPVVRRYVGRFRGYVVLGGAVMGYTLATLNKPFWCWLSTLYQDELLAKIDMHSPDTEKMVNSRGVQAHLRQERFVLERAGVIAAISEHTAERVRVAYPSLASKVTVIPVPVDTELFRPANGLHPHPGTAESRRVIWVGRPEDPRKNVPLLLSAFQKVLAHFPNSRLTMVGTGVDRLAKMIEQFGMTHAVELQPAVTTAEHLADLYRQSSVFVLSSRQEGLGIVVHEAMSSGLPVVTTRCGGPEGAVIEGKTGYLVPLDDASQMADRLITLLGDSTASWRMGAQAREMAARQWARDAVSPKILNAFEKVCPSLLPS